MQITITTNDSSNPPGLVAHAEIHFSDGPLSGLKLIGFSVWQRRGGGYNVTFPARSYSVNGERRSFALLRPIADASAQETIRAAILTAYYEHTAEDAGPQEPPAGPTYTATAQSRCCNHSYCTTYTADPSGLCDAHRATTSTPDLEF